MTVQSRIKIAQELLDAQDSLRDAYMAALEVQTEADTPLSIAIEAIRDKMARLADRVARGEFEPKKRAV